MIEVVFIIGLTLLAVFLLPWMMKRDYQRRNLSAMRNELIDNVKNIDVFLNDSAADNKDLIVKDQVFQSIRISQFNPGCLDDKDMETIEDTLRSLSDKGGGAGEERIDIFKGHKDVLSSYINRISDFLGQ